MSLISLVDNYRTDKNTTHSYLELYEQLLHNKKDSALNVLEVGICYGGSIKLWNDYFVNATVYGLDIMPNENVWEGIKNNNRIKLFTSTNAYNQDFVNSTFVSNNIQFDFVLDDGPHTLESMKDFIRLYSPLLKEDGILIIEDVQSWDWIQILMNEVPAHLTNFVSYYDLRPNKKRYDDIVFVINKSITNA